MLLSLQMHLSFASEYLPAVLRESSCVTKYLKHELTGVGTGVKT